jgi:GNAT superfamily N-acetyltransferase
MASVDGDLSIRDATPEDAASLATAWREFAEYYVDIDPAQFQIPKEAGVAAWIRARIEREQGGNAIWLIAERNGRMVGYVQAQVSQPSDDADRQIMREVTEIVLKVDSLFVTAGERRLGVGAALMDAAEEWGRSKGASQAVVISYAYSPSSVPFYEERMRYQRKTIGFWKPL